MTTATTADAVRTRMLELQRQGHSYHFLCLVSTYLEAVPEDHQVRLLAAREYLDLGLVEPAQELFDPPGGVILPAELVQLGDSVAAIRGGSIPWTTCRDVFESNVAALSSRGIDVQPICECWFKSERRYQLFRDRHGVAQVRKRDEAGTWRWFPGLGHHRNLDDARPLPKAIGSPMPGPYLFEGVGLGGYFERLYKTTRDTFLRYSCALYIVEPHPDHLAVALHLNDWGALLADHRVHTFLGPRWSVRLADAWRENPDLPLPSEIITCGVSGKLRAVDVVRSAVEQRGSAIGVSLADLQRRYAARDIAYWNARFAEALEGQGPPLRILAAVSTHTTFLQYSMRDTKRAFESLGHRCTVLSEKTPYTTTSPLTFHQAIRELDPDLFFVLDHVRPEFHGFIPDNLPILTWDQDHLPHVVTRANLQRVARHDFLVGCSKSHCVLHGFNPHQYLHARVPTCPEQFSGEPLSEAEEARYACDVSYVSHASQTPSQFHEQEKAGYAHSGLSRLLDEMYGLLPEQLAIHRTASGGVMSHVLNEACRRIGVANLDADLQERLRTWYLWRLADRMFRHEALEWVAQWARQAGRSFRIYGRGWDHHPTLSEFAAGPAENGRELLCIYRASKINLQLMPAGFIHQRSLDGLAAGGFFLTRLCPQDLRGIKLRALERRITELGIPSTDCLLGHSDRELRRLLDEYLGGWLGRMDHYKYDLLTSLRADAELLYPDESFLDFPAILFDSAEQFAERAEFFLRDASAREGVAGRMRQVVVERFSYPATIRRFLEAMAAYLRQIASESPAH